METTEVLKYLQREIHTVVAATVDGEGRPVTCAIDMMDADEGGLYFLTARGKGFYDRLKSRGYIAMTGVLGKDTMSSVAVSVQGRVRELGDRTLPGLFEKNPYMGEIYPTEESRRALTVFQLYEGTGEWFDLSKKPIERFSFAFGGEENSSEGYFITGICDGCGACAALCPQNCIQIDMAQASIQQEHCLRCGNCLEACPRGAVIRRG